MKTISATLFFPRLLAASIFATALLQAQTFPASPGAGSVPKLASPFHAIASDFFGVNIETVYLGSAAIPWNDPALENAMEEVGLESVRFPGGDAGNYWDWQNGGMYPRGGSNPVQDPLSNLSSLAQAIRVHPTYNLNVMTYENRLIDAKNLTAAIDNQLEMLRTAQGLGLPVRNLELGNEFFWSGYDHDHAFPTAKDYATTMNIWTKALRARYPYAKIAAVGSIPYKLDSRTQSWNGPVLDDIQGVDAITLHRYDSIIDGGVYDGTPPEAVLGLAFSDWSKILSEEIGRVEAKSLRVWITEFGGFSDCTSAAQFTGTWLEALYQTEMAVQFLSRASIEQIELYNITGSTSSIMFQNSSAYYDACLGKAVTFNAIPGDLTATGQAYALLGEALKEAESVAEVTLPEAPVINPGSGGKPYPSATGVALRGAARQWIMTNFGAEPLTLSYPGMGTGSIESLSAASLTTIVASQNVLQHTTQQFNGSSFVLPAYSVNRIVGQ